MTTQNTPAASPATAEPREQLDPRAVTLWRLNGLLAAIPVLALAAAGAWLLWRLDAPQSLIAVALLGIVVAMAAAAWLLPPALWRHWRYEIGEEAIDLQHGWLTVTRTVIPVARIQHVDTQRGPLERRLGLASVVLYTAAGSSTIPSLARDVADALRDRVAALANMRDDL